MGSEKLLHTIWQIGIYLDYPKFFSVFAKALVPSLVPSKSDIFQTGFKFFLYEINFFWLWGVGNPYSFIREVLAQLPANLIFFEKSLLKCCIALIGAWAPVFQRLVLVFRNLSHNFPGFVS